MTAAYNRIYLDDAMNLLGEALDYVSNACQMDVELFLDMFIAGGYAPRVEEGESAVVSGLSGTELVKKVLYDCGLEIAFPDAIVDYESQSVEFVVGRLLAYLQWCSGRPFGNLMKHISYEKLEDYVIEFNDAPEENWQTIADKLLAGIEEPVKIQYMRKKCGFSQKQLAEAANVNIRTLQQYEIKTKDINKAATVTVIELAKTLGCTIQDLLEL